MNPAEQKELVIETLRRRERIAEETKTRIAELDKGVVDPLAEVDPDVRRQAEEEYAASLGRRRYVTSDGRVLFLTPEEIAHRRRAKAQRAKDGGGDELDDPRRSRAIVLWAFNAAVVLLAIVVGWVLLR